MCDKKNSILFTETECLVLSPDFKLLDESQVVLKVPRQNNMYSFDVKNVVPSGGLACLFAKATIDESNLWHRRLGHINFKTMNKLVRGNLVRGLPSKIFENDHSCVAYQKGKQHKASCKTKLDETSGILKTFITGIENQINHKVKIIRCDNGTEFKNNDMNQLCGMKGIKREFSVARTPQQNGVAERKNRTLIEAARTMLADWSGPEWLFDIDSLTKSMNYEPVTAGNQTNGDADDKDADEVPDKGDDDVSQRNGQEKEGGASNKEDDQYVQDFRAELDSLLVQQKEGYANSTNRDSTASPSVSTAGPSINTASENINTGSLNINIASPIPNDSSMQSLENTGIFDDAYDDREVGAEADLNNLETTMNVSPIPTTRIHKDHPKDQIIGDINSATQTRRMTKISEEHAMVSYIKKQRRTNHKDYQNCLFACFLSQIEPKKVWTLVDLPKGKRAIGTKWVYRNKKDERGIVVRNKARLVAQGYTQEEGIDYDEVFAPVARIEAIRLFLAYASFMGLIVYQMDVKSAFLYGTIEEEVFRRGTIDKTLFIKKEKGDILLVQVYVDDIIFGSTKNSLCVEFEQMMHKSQDKYVADILKKFDFTIIKAARTPIETNKALNKDEEAKDVDVHLYRLMIGSLMYLTTSRPDIMFVVCACARFQVTPKTSHLHAVKRIFRYLKGQPKLGNPQQEVLWIQNQMLDYGFNFMNTKIHIDNESTICIVKNPVFHSKTKHIEIRHHFIRDSYEKKLVQVIKIHTDHNVADLLTKAFDVSRKAKRTTEISQSSGPIHLVADETVYKEWEDRMERAATTASSLEAEQDSGSGPRCQDTILGGAEAQIRFEAASKQSNDLPLLRVNTLGSGEDSMKLKELMELCIKLSERILDIKTDRVNW
ncbi:putative ribonuclease H-like domain-containing protein [Tanacetum coccineum]